MKREHSDPALAANGTRSVLTRVFRSMDAVQWVCAIGTLYFLVSTTFSVVHFEHKFLYDGTAHVFHMANSKTFPAAAQREVFYLQQFAPVLVARAGGGIQEVMIAYVLNVFLLYFILFAIIAFVLKDVPMAVLYLLVHYRGDPFNYNIMVEELLPGACFIVLLFALLRNVDVFKRREWAYASAGVCMVFIVRSHPLAVTAFVLTAPIFLLAHGRELRKQCRGVSAVLVVFVLLLAQKFLALNSYDIERLSEAKGLAQLFSEVASPDYLKRLGWVILGTRWFFLAALVLTGWYLIQGRRFRELAVMAFFLIMSVGLFNLNANDIPHVNWGEIHLKYDQWTLPVRFVVFAAFSLLVPMVWLRGRWRLFLSLSLVLFGLSLRHVHYVQQVSSDFLDQVSRIVEVCEEDGVSKAILPYEEIGSWPPVHNTAYQDIMVYSSLWGGPTVQVVYEDPGEHLSHLTEGTEEMVILGQGEQLIPMYRLDTALFPVEEESYTYISLDDDSLAGDSDMQ